MTNEAAGHHRINERLNAYWEHLRGHRAMPRESDVSIDDLKDIWPHCFLVATKNGMRFCTVTSVSGWSRPMAMI